MKIRLTKISNDKHSLEVVRSDGSRESVELVTREALFHDLLHHAVEAAMGTQGGFWGALAAGKTMADLNDRTGAAMKGRAHALGLVEQAVGMMTGFVNNGVPEVEAVAVLRGYHKSMGLEPPAWCNESFVIDVRERMRKLQGHWKATHFGKSMEFEWDETQADGVQPITASR